MVLRAQVNETNLFICMITLSFLHNECKCARTSVHVRLAPFQKVNSPVCLRILRIASELHIPTIASDLCKIRDRQPVSPYSIARRTA